MVLGVITPQIILSWSPIYQEVALRISAMHPVKAHTNRACAALLYCGVDDSTCCGVVSEDRGGMLGLTHLRQGKAQFFTLSCTVCTGLLRVTGPCGGLEGSGEASLEKKCPPALLCTCVSNIKEALEWMWSTILLALYLRTASGWVAQHNTLRCQSPVVSAACPLVEGMENSWVVVIIVVLY
eukprot:4143995-Ditylum_brightwellii.AAC.1